MREFTDDEGRRRVRALSAAGGSRPYLLGIVGEPGAGKSTFAESLGVPVLPMDGYHYANEQLERRGLLDRKGAPETFDAAGYAAALRRLRAGEGIVVPRFDRVLDAAIAGAIALDSTSPLIVTEGNYLLLDDIGWRDVRTLLDEVWFIEVPDGLRRARLVRRHRSFGRSDADAARWVESVDEPNARLIRATRSRADAIIHPSSKEETEE